METLDLIDKNGAKHLVYGGEVTRPLGDGLWEIKKGKHRIYYVYCIRNRVYVLHACFKQKQKAEEKDIRIGRARMREIQNLEKNSKMNDG